MLYLMLVDVKFVVKGSLTLLANSMEVLKFDICFLEALSFMNGIKLYMLMI